eukprot:g82015.t1
MKNDKTSSTRSIRAFWKYKAVVEALAICGLFIALLITQDRYHYHYYVKESASMDASAAGAGASITHHVKDYSTAHRTALYNLTTIFFAQHGQSAEPCQYTHHTIYYSGRLLQHGQNLCFFQDDTQPINVSAIYLVQLLPQGLGHQAILLYNNTPQHIGLSAQLEYAETLSNRTQSWFFHSLLHQVQHSALAMEMTTIQLDALLQKAVPTDWKSSLQTANTSARAIVAQSFFQSGQTAGVVFLDAMVGSAASSVSAWTITTVATEHTGQWFLRCASYTMVVLVLTAFLVLLCAAPIAVLSKHLLSDQQAAGAFPKKRQQGAGAATETFTRLRTIGPQPSKFFADECVNDEDAAHQLTQHWIVLALLLTGSIVLALLLTGSIVLALLLTGSILLALLLTGSIVLALLLTGSIVLALLLTGSIVLALLLTGSIVLALLWTGFSLVLPSTKQMGVLSWYISLTEITENEHGVLQKLQKQTSRYFADVDEDDEQDRSAPGLEQAEARDSSERFPTIHPRTGSASSNGNGNGNGNKAVPANGDVSGSHAYGTNRVVPANGDVRVDVNANGRDSTGEPAHNGGMNLGDVSLRDSLVL